MQFIEFPSESGVPAGGGPRRQRVTRKKDPPGMFSPGRKSAGWSGATGRHVRASSVLKLWRVPPKGLRRFFSALGNPDILARFLAVAAETEV
jgi:hypothetical protein